MDGLLGVMLGVGLAASCGFRVFVPLFVVSLAAGSGAVELAPAFEWLGSPAARVVFGSASVAEVLAYYVPWVDNLLDAVATPGAVVAGTVVSASVLTDMSPLLRWTLAIIAGGGAAGTVQVATSALRAGSSVTTAGIANPFLATAELGGAAGLSLLSLAVPVLAVALMVGFVVVVLRLRGRLDRRRRGGHPATTASGPHIGSQ